MLRGVTSALQKKIFDIYIKIRSVGEAFSSHKNRLIDILVDQTNLNSLICRGTHWF